MHPVCALAAAPSSPRGGAGGGVMREQVALPVVGRARARTPEHARSQEPLVLISDFILHRQSTITGPPFCFQLSSQSLAVSAAALPWPEPSAGAWHATLEFQRLLCSALVS